MKITKDIFKFIQLFPLKMVKAIVAEDNIDWRKKNIGAIRIAAPDAEIEQVETGEDLVAKVLSGNFSLVVSDINMGSQIDGLEATRRIRKAGQTVPIVIVAKGDKRAEVLRAGGTDYINKADYASELVAERIAPYIR